MARKSELRDIVISVKRSVFRSDDPDKDMANDEFKRKRPEILARDGNSCVFCGFKADKFQEVHHLDDNHANNSDDNLVTACALCHANHHLGYSGIKGRGALIYLNPDWGYTQASINNIVRLLWIAEESENKDISMIATSTLARLIRCAVDAKKLVGSDELSIMADFLLSADAEKYDSRSKVLAGIYVMPRKEGFSQQLAHWRTMESLNLRSIQEIAVQRMKQWSNSDGNILELCKALNIEAY